MAGTEDCPLHDDIIEQIFSFLPTRDVVKTCVLSRRWRPYWTTVSDLRFSVSSHHDSFVDRILRLYGRGKVRKFHLDINSGQIWPSNIDSWVGFAIDHEVEEFRLNLNICYDYNWLEQIPWGDYTLSPLLYNCSSLTRLVLRGCLYPPCESINWSSLKSLSLDNVTGDVLQKILMSSPVLEYLNLERFLAVEEIHSRSLRELVIDASLALHSLRISTPQLLSLRVRLDYFHEIIRIVEVPSLLEAELDFDGPTISDFYPLKEMLCKLQNATRMLFGPWSCWVMQSLKVEDVQVSLPKCKSLTLHLPVPRFSFPAIANMLATTPNLEKLVIIFKPDVRYSNISDLDSCNVDHESYWHIKKKFKRWARHLKNVEIFGLDGCLRFNYEEVLMLVKFLLGHAFVLENMVIKVMNRSQHLEVVGSHKLHKVARRLQCYHKASKHAAVILNYLEEENGKR